MSISNLVKEQQACFNHSDVLLHIIIAKKLSTYVATSELIVKLLDHSLICCTKNTHKTEEFCEIETFITRIVEYYKTGYSNEACRVLDLAEKLADDYISWYGGEYHGYDCFIKQGEHYCIDCSLKCLFAYDTELLKSFLSNEDTNFRDVFGCGLDALHENSIDFEIFPQDFYPDGCYCFQCSDEILAPNNEDSF